MKTVPGKIVLIDREPVEKQLLEMALEEKNWKAQIKFFDDAEKALKYLETTDDRIFIIMAEINMQKMSGFQLKKKIDANIELRKKLIPFIFTSISPSKKQIKEAYSCQVQGYFNKPLEIKEQAETLDIIIRYWIKSMYPTKKNGHFV